MEQYNFKLPDGELERWRIALAKMHKRTGEYISMSALIRREIRAALGVR